ncbi:hypothetical protein ACW9HR_37165 [Nocardia gipuzkoensis]
MTGERTVWIGPWLPVPPGDCHCSAINDTITFWNFDCPQHGYQPVIPPRHVELLDPHSAATPAEVWRAVTAQAPWALGQWHAHDVRPAFVEDRIVWVCATFISGTRTDDSAEYSFATRTGGWSRMNYPTRRITPRLLEEAR